MGDARGPFLAGWTVMMAAMMLPSALPMIRISHLVAAGAPRPWTRTAIAVGLVDAAGLAPPHAATRSVPADRTAKYTEERRLGMRRATLPAVDPPTAHCDSYDGRG